MVLNFSIITDSPVTSPPTFTVTFPKDRVDELFHLWYCGVCGLGFDLRRVPPSTTSDTDEFSRKTTATFGSHSSSMAHSVNQVAPSTHSDPDLLNDREVGTPQHGSSTSQVASPVLPSIIPCDTQALLATQKSQTLELPTPSVATLVSVPPPSSPPPPSKIESSDG